MFVDKKTVEIIRRFEMDSGVKSATFSTKGQQILTVGQNDIAVWSLPDGKEIFKIRLTETEEIVDAQFGPDSGQIAMIVKNRDNYRLSVSVSVSVYDSNNRSKPNSFDIDHGNSQFQIREILLSPDSHWIVSVDKNIQGLSLEYPDW